MSCVSLDACRNRFGGFRRRRDIRIRNGLSLLDYLEMLILTHGPSGEERAGLKLSTRVRTRVQVLVWRKEIAEWTEKTPKLGLAKKKKNQAGKRQISRC